MENNINTVNGVARLDVTIDKITTYIPYVIRASTGPVYVTVQGYTYLALTTVYG